MKANKLNFSVQDVVHESDLDKNFGKRIAKLAHGEKLHGCIQCGNCSSACPFSQYMDFTPRKVIAMVKAGFRDDVLANRTVWLCASCYSCTVECPKGIKITDIMYALKREAIMKKVYPARFTIPAMSRTFYGEVRNGGRIGEMSLLIKFFMRTNIFKAIGFSSLGWKLFSTGRLKFFEKKIKDKEGLRKMIDCCSSTNV
ncbi:MAG: 4Fe-4S dicluster domain-containing protein [Bacteroidota bacterium]